MHPLDNKPHCKTRNLFDWLRGQKQRRDFADSAQTALDTPEAAPASGLGRGTLYRAGMTLADLKPGECGTVRRLLGASQGRLRLLEMGLTPGVHIQVVRAAAFGGPLDILVRGYQLSLRRDEAASIWLDDEDSDK